MVIQIDENDFINLSHVESMYKKGDSFFIRMVSGREIPIDELYFGIMLDKWRKQDTIISETVL